MSCLVRQCLNCGRVRIGRRCEPCRRARRKARKAAAAAAARQRQETTQ